MQRLSIVALLAAATVLLASTQRGAAELGDVDVAIVLAVDCSYSVDDQEFRQQMDGLAFALTREDVQAAIRLGPNKRIAITLVQWAGVGGQRVAVPWRIISGPAEAKLAAIEIKETRRLAPGGATSVSSAIDAGLALHLQSPFRALRRIIDISSDGYNNTGGQIPPARTRALAAGVTLNALAILTEYDFLGLYYQNRVIAGAGAFVIVAEDYSSYHDAIRRKLIREITGPVV